MNQRYRHFWIILLNDKDKWCGIITKNNQICKLVDLALLNQHFKHQIRVDCKHLPDEVTSISGAPRPAD